MRVISANVNGIRAVERRGGLDWLGDAEPDVLCLQEVRADERQLAAVLRGTAFEQWHVAHAPCATAGRAGVAVLSREAQRQVRVELDDVGFADCGRWVEAVLPGPGGSDVTVVSTYVHTGQAGTVRQDEKYAFLDAVAARMKELEADGQRALVTGDLNICHRRADLRNWRGNAGRAGFLPREQAYLDAWVGAEPWQGAGEWVDVVRRAAGDVGGPYTWWSWRGKAFDNDTGWRIDYQLATRALADTVTATSVGRAPSYARRWSDHAPVVVDYGTR